MPSTPSHTIVCLRNQQVARDVHELRFAKPPGFSFVPGQFVLFEVPLLGNPADSQTRSLSIASSPSDDHLLFIMKLKEHGRISDWIREKLCEGTKVQMKGPFGLFTLKRESPKEYLFIATSTGVGPFRSKLRWLLPQGESRRIDLVFGARSEEDLFWAEELQDTSKEYENFSLHLALSDPSPSWKGHWGRVQTLVPKIVDDFSRKAIYICGSPEMTKEVKELCLTKWGVPKEDVHVEGYI